VVHLVLTHQSVRIKGGGGVEWLAGGVLAPSTSPSPATRRSSRLAEARASNAAASSRCTRASCNNTTIKYGFQEGYNRVLQFDTGFGRRSTGSSLFDTDFSRRQQGPHNSIRILVGF
jgi:hypothetical protein